MFLVYVLRAISERIEVDVAAARAFVQDLFTFRGVESSQRRNAYDFVNMPL